MSKRLRRLLLLSALVGVNSVLLSVGDAPAAENQGTGTCDLCYGSPHEVGWCCFVNCEPGRQCCHNVGDCGSG